MSFFWLVVQLIDTIATFSLTFRRFLRGPPPALAQPLPTPRSGTKGARVLEIERQTGATRRRSRGEVVWAWRRGGREGCESGSEDRG